MMGKAPNMQRRSGHRSSSAVVALLIPQMLFWIFDALASLFTCLKSESVLAAVSLANRCSPQMRTEDCESGGEESEDGRNKVHISDFVFSFHRLC